ncbi:hypothetical protein GEV33_012654 [Tenebrio molitor]|uniref:Uncharacterized protein n=1 Tax=Tenebrio molitor TaxID=7067 RepID=A0A8J6H9X9_TENMO|nr:hypothetical protein GEV33_012654 [Tenebrio molitor]
MIGGTKIAISVGLFMVYGAFNRLLLRSRVHAHDEPRRGQIFTHTPQGQLSLELIPEKNAQLAEAPPDVHDATTVSVFVFPPKNQRRLKMVALGEHVILIIRCAAGRGNKDREYLLLAGAARRVTEGHGLQHPISGRQDLLGQHMSKAMNSVLFKHVKEHSLSIELTYAFLKSADRRRATGRDNALFARLTDASIKQIGGFGVFISDRWALMIDTHKMRRLESRALGSSAPLPPIVSTHTHVEMEHDHARLPTYKLAIFVEELDLVQHADIASDDEAAVTFVGLSLKARFSGTLSVFSPTPSATFRLLVLSFEAPVKKSKWLGRNSRAEGRRGGLVALCGGRRLGPRRGPFGDAALPFTALHNNIEIRWLEKKKGKIGYRKIQINGEWFIWDEREDKLKKIFLEEGQKKRRRTGEKRYKKKVNKTVDGPRKRKPEKKHKWEDRYQKSTNEKVKGQKEKRKELLPGNNKKRENKKDAWKEKWI